MFAKPNLIWFSYEFIFQTLLFVVYLVFPNRQKGAALFFDFEMSFSGPRDWSIVFGRGIDPAIRLRKEHNLFFTLFALF